MRMTYTQYSLQLHIHINTASNYILHVNVILFKQERAMQGQLGVRSAGSLSLLQLVPSSRLDAPLGAP